jgi:predicted aldo/keto reductase-like oxidoreductase
MSEFKSLNRRDFFKKAAAGLGGYVMLSKDTGKSESDEKPQQRKMVYRTLGKTGISLPVISMGVMNSDNPNLVKAALDNGITHLDTAWYYQRGRNETMIGSVVKNYPRDSYIIATKIFEQARDRQTGTFTTNATAKGFLEKFDESLNRLKLDYVDILYMHMPDTPQMALYKPFLKAMEKIKKEGRTRFVGVSTHWNEPAIIETAVASQFYDVVLTSYNFKQHHRKQVEDAIAKAAEAGLGIVAMKTLAGGYLDESKTKPVDPKAALRFVLKNENVHTVIAGFTTFEQMEVDLSVMEDLIFTEKDEKSLELGYNSSGGVYCQGCQTCIRQCPKHLPIPDLMRAHMYAYAYKNYEKARDLVTSLNVTPEQCRDCAICTVKCPMGFNVRQKFSEVASLKHVPERLLT